MNTPASRPWLLLAGGVVLATVIVLALGWVAGRLPVASGVSATRWLELAFTLVLFGMLACAGLLGMRRAGGLPVFAGRDASQPAALGLAVGAGALVAAFLYALLAGVAIRVPVRSAAGFGWLFAGSIAVILQTAAEEIYFRGWLQRALGRDWPAAGALVAAAAAFALLHLVGGSRAPLALFNIFLAGILFGLLMERTGSLAAPIAAHAAYNWMETLVLGLDPNPGTGSFGALWDFDLVGPALWGGSSEGLNASMGLACVLTALILPLAFVRPSGAPRVQTAPS